MEFETVFSDFQAKHPEWSWRPPLTALEVKQFEERFQIQLPEPYVAFITTVGNGTTSLQDNGEDPLFEPLNLQLTPDDPDSMFSQLHRPFLWNRLFFETQETPERKGVSDDDDAEEEERRAPPLTSSELEIRRSAICPELREQYRGQEQDRQGCLLLQFDYDGDVVLVTSGPFRGSVWIVDDKSDYLGVIPKHGSFLDFLAKRPVDPHAVALPPRPHGWNE